MDSLLAHGVTVFVELLGDFFESVDDFFEEAEFLLQSEIWVRLALVWGEEVGFSSVWAVCGDSIMVLAKSGLSHGKGGEFWIGYAKIFTFSTFINSTSNSPPNH